MKFGFIAGPDELRLLDAVFSLCCKQNAIVSLDDRTLVARHIMTMFSNGICQERDLLAACGPMAAALGKRRSRPPIGALLAGALPSVG